MGPFLGIQLYSDGLIGSVQCVQVARLHLTTKYSILSSNASIMDIILCTMLFHVQLMIEVYNVYYIIYIYVCMYAYIQVKICLHACT